MKQAEAIVLAQDIRTLQQAEKPDGNLIKDKQNELLSYVKPLLTEEGQAMSAAGVLVVTPTLYEALEPLGINAISLETPPNYLGEAERLVQKRTAEFDTGDMTEIVNGQGLNDIIGTVNMTDIMQVLPGAERKEVVQR